MYLRYVGSSQDCPYHDLSLGKQPQILRTNGRTSRVHERHALAREHGEVDAAQHRELDPALRAERERLVESLDDERRRRHGWSTEETRSCV